MIGIDHQHLGAVARGRERDVQRDDAAVMVGAGTDHGHHRRGIDGTTAASGAQMSHIALRKVVSGKPVRSVGQPNRVRSGVGAKERIPPSVRITLDSCRRHHWLFGRATALWRGAVWPAVRGGAASALSPARIRFGARFTGRQAVGGDDPCPAASPPNTKPTIASTLIAGGKVRRCGTVASPMIRALEVLRLSCSSVSRERLRKD